MVFDRVKTAVGCMVESLSIKNVLVSVSERLDSFCPYLTPLPSSIFIHLYLAIWMCRLVSVFKSIVSNTANIAAYILDKEIVLIALTSQYVSIQLLFRTVTIKFYTGCSSL